MPIAVALPDPQNGSSDEGDPVPRWMLIAAVSLLVLTTAIYAAIYVSGPGFKELFAGFGAEMPGLTRVVLASYKFYGILALVGIVPTVHLIRNRACLIGNRSRILIPIIASFGLALFMLGVFVMAMYMPIFEMGSVADAS